MIWAEKHFAYAHNIRYVMLCYVTYFELLLVPALVEVARQRTENESGDWIHRVRGPPGHMVIVRMRKV